MKAAVCVIGLLAAGGVCSQSAVLTVPARLNEAAAVRDGILLSAEGGARDGRASGTPGRVSPQPEFWAAYRVLPERGGSFWNSPGLAGPLEAGSDGDVRSLLSASRWLEARPGVSSTLDAGYAHRGMHAAGIAISHEHEDRDALPGNASRPISRSARFSFSPARDWVVQFSRGSASGLDYLVPGDEVRRSALSATYSYKLGDGDGKTTFAWGRNSRKFRESTLGYLMESSLRFNGGRVLFGRLERVSSDDLARQNDLAQRQLFKLNKLTAGYYQDVRVTTSLALDVGVFVSRHFVPPDMAPSYGGSPTAYMMFVRAKIQ